MTMWKPLFFLLASLGATTAGSAQENKMTLSDPAKQTPSQIMADAENVHPAALYILAAKLMAEGRMDEAVRWFYIGQLRYRFHLASKPVTLPNDQPLFSALSESVGRPINEYAFGDVDAAIGQIDAALAWDARHPNNFTSKERYATELAQVRAGLQSLRDDMAARKDEIRETRKRNGLENR
ncbi:hypothetical protein [uncultured Sphingomonas sp.]|uniref:hypothetical protein n=1 Tax=uncultured Sphingomonas sp. TaxID=158754 RepID=UPI0025E7DFE2|nr:hypothetical protein [uncultured Sphingomonas sp.]